MRNTAMPLTSHLGMLHTSTIILCVCAEPNGNVICMWCASFTIPMMLGDVNYWLLDNHGVVSDTPTICAHLMLVISEGEPLHNKDTFCLCFPCHLRLVHSFMVPFIQTVETLMTQS